jgi:hypothetical protein
MYFLYELCQAIFGHLVRVEYGKVSSSKWTPKKTKETILDCVLNIHIIDSIVNVIGRTNFIN